MIKAQEQSGRTAKAGECNTTFDPTSTEALPGGADFQAWLRANCEAARDGIETNLALRVLHDPEWSNDRRRSTIAFYGVDFEAPVVPLPTPASTAAHPVMMGRLEYDEFTAIHSAEGSWANMRARQTEGSIEFPRGTFIFRWATRGGAAATGWYGFRTQGITRGTSA